ncbi:hypothetical protein FKP32DRAFT_1685402 [Trametes sanguinea]|nr:hypothetical protein FKP32DRAFT_1685402 [Trametes sanguinea]
MPPGDNLQRLRSFPRAPAPNSDASVVKSNLSKEEVELQQNILAYHVAHHPDSAVFGNVQAKGLQLLEVYVRPRREEPREAPSASLEKTRQHPGTDALKRPDDLEAFTLCEAVVEEGMLNVHGTLAGACAMLLVDIATFSCLFALGTVVNIDPTGFTTSVNLVWHNAAMPGTVLRFVSTSLSLKPRMGVARCEVYDKATGRLLISGTQIITPIQAPKAIANQRAKM